MRYFFGMFDGKINGYGSPVSEDKLSKNDIEALIKRKLLMEISKESFDKYFEIANLKKELEQKLCNTREKLFETEVNLRKFMDTFTN